MPRAYRTMKAEGNPPLPVVGESATTLGVRVRDFGPTKPPMLSPAGAVCRSFRPLPD